MAEVSERERKEKKEKRLARRAVENPSNPDDLKVIFRCTPEQKKRLIEIAAFHKLTMTDVMIKSINAAYHAMEAQKAKKEGFDA